MNHPRKNLFQRNRIALTLGQLALGALLVFHGWLLLRRLASGDLFDSAVVWRWLGALLLLLFWGLERKLAKRLSPHARRRSDLAFWSLVLLLHTGGAPITPAGVMLQAIPLAEIGSLALPLFAAVLLIETFGAALRASGQATLRRSRLILHPLRHALSSGFLPLVSCRPPPAR